MIVGLKCTAALLTILGIIQINHAGYRKDARQRVQMGEFPCGDRNYWRSREPPKSVHKLRPGDIDVVAAIGDSLTAGSGALTDNLYEVMFEENRGVSWSIGGQGNWSEFLTVPNLLKVMNPNLVGYSTGSGDLFSTEAQFNTAFNGAMDQDLLDQAAWLVYKMRKDPRVDFENHWKMITIMIGTNDVCSDQCYVRGEGVRAHRYYLTQLLDYLYYKVPKCFVNLVSMPYIPSYADLTDPPFATCITMKLVMCSCLFGGPAEADKLENVVEMTRAFQKVQREVVESGRYDRRDDFTVVYQPTHLNSKFPKLERSTRSDPHDYSYVSIDCIHYTQKLHAILARVFWNNLFEEPGNKTSTWDGPAYSKFLCPDRKRPYLLTYRNHRISQLLQREPNSGFGR